MKPSRWLAATGAGLCWAAAPPTAIGALLLGVSAVFAAASLEGSPRQDALRGLWLGTVAQAGVLLWLPSTWTAFTGSGAIGVYVLTVGIQAVPSAVALGIAGWALSKKLPLPAAAGAGWLLAAAVGTWVQVVPTPASLWLVAVPGLSWAAAVGGAPLLDGLWAVWGASLLDTPKQAAGAALLYALLAGAWLMPGDRGVPQQVALIQPGTGAFDGSRASTAPDRTHKLLRLLDEVTRADWIATSESAWPVDPGERPGARRSAFLGAFGQRPPTLLGATVRGEGLYNRTLAVVDGDITDHVDKSYLVPGAEKPVLGLGRGDYASGTGRRVLSIAGTQVGVLICYEDLLPQAVAAAVWQGAEVLVAPSNDTWLGPGKGGQLHLAGAKLAAVTSGRWLVRPTTSGTSAVIDPRGRLRWTAPWIDGDLHPNAPGYVHTAEIRHRGGAWSGVLASAPISLLVAMLLLVWARRERS